MDQYLKEYIKDAKQWHSAMHGGRPWSTCASGWCRLARRIEQESESWPYIYRYAWKNNAKRAEMFGKRCMIVKCLALHSALIEFENGQREVVDRWALRRWVATTSANGDGIPHSQDRR